jgi:hypothetical protein
MPTDRASRVLEEFSAVTDAAPRPDSHARRIEMRSRFPMATLTGAVLVAVVVAVAAIVLGRPGPGPGPGVGSSPSTAATAVATAPSASSPVVSASTGPTDGTCDATTLVARITAWEGAAGSRIAHVELRNTGASTCLIASLDRPQLVDGEGGVLIDGKAPSGGDVLTLEPGGVVTTLVAANNYCKPAPPPPVSVAFVWSNGGRIIAAPLSPTDTTLPPCLGQGSPGTIDMHPWAP